MAEQLALEEIERNGRAVHLDERAAAPRAEFVNRPRNQFLAGAGLALNQHRRLGWRHSFDLLEHGLHAVLAPMICSNRRSSDCRSRLSPVSNGCSTRPPSASAFLPDQLFNAAGRCRRGLVVEWLGQELDGSARSACIRMRASPWAVMKIVGILISRR
jgi:hypothetical protein